MQPADLSGLLIACWARSQLTLDTGVCRLHQRRWSHRHLVCGGGLERKHGARLPAPHKVGGWHGLELLPCRAHASHVSSLSAAKEARCMGESRTPKRALSEARQQRLAAQLRANLAKRKTQGRARAAAERASVHQVADNSNQKSR